MKRVTLTSTLAVRQVYWFADDEVRTQTVLVPELVLDIAEDDLDKDTVLAAIQAAAEASEWTLAATLAAQYRIRCCLRCGDRNPRTRLQRLVDAQYLGTEITHHVGNARLCGACVQAAFREG